jgi:hypothetical protein
MTSSPKTWGDQLQIGVIKNLTIERRPQQQPPPGALISQKLFKTFPTTSPFGVHFFMGVWSCSLEEKQQGERGEEVQGKKQAKTIRKNN